MKKILYFLLITFLGSCAEFDSPQPYGVAPLKTFPTVLLGKYFIDDKEFVPSISISEKEILFIDYKQGRYRMQDVKRIGDNYYVAHQNNFNIEEVVCELTNITFSKDSVVADVIMEDRFELGRNCHIMKVDDFYTINFGINSRDGAIKWSPIFIDNFGSNYRAYYLSDSYTEKLEVRDSLGHLINYSNLKDSDIRVLFENRSSNLRLAWEFDVQRKRFKTYD
jgi:hypothetical protein